MLAEIIKNSLDFWLRETGLAPAEKRSEKIRFREPPATVRRKEEAAVKVALDGFRATGQVNGLDLRDLMDAIVGAEANGTLHAFVPTGRGTRRVPLTTRRVQTYLSAEGVRTAWGSESRPTPRRGSARMRRRPGRRR